VEEPFPLGDAAQRIGRALEGLKSGLHNARELVRKEPREEELIS
jgi:hypothetical protein